MIYVCNDSMDIDVNFSFFVVILVAVKVHMQYLSLRPAAESVRRCTYMDLCKDMFLFISTRVPRYVECVRHLTLISRSLSLLGLCRQL